MAFLFARSSYHNIPYLFYRLKRNSFYETKSMSLLNRGRSTNRYRVRERKVYIQTEVNVYFCFRALYASLCGRSPMSKRILSPRGTYVTFSMVKEVSIYFKSIFLSTNHIQIGCAISQLTDQSIIFNHFLNIF